MSDVRVEKYNSRTQVSNHPTVKHGTYLKDKHLVCDVWSLFVDVCMGVVQDAGVIISRTTRFLHSLLGVCVCVDDTSTICIFVGASASKYTSTYICTYVLATYMYLDVLCPILSRMYIYIYVYVWCDVPCRVIHV